MKTDLTLIRQAATCKTQEIISKDNDISQEMISQYENGKRYSDKLTDYYFRLSTSNSEFMSYEDCIKLRMLRKVVKNHILTYFKEHSSVIEYYDNIYQEK